MVLQNDIEMDVLRVYWNTLPLCYTKQDAFRAVVVKFCGVKSIGQSEAFHFVHRALLGSFFTPVFSNYGAYQSYFNLKNIPSHTVVSCGELCSERQQEINELRKAANVLDGFYEAGYTTEAAFKNAMAAVYPKYAGGHPNDVDLHIFYDLLFGLRHVTNEAEITLKKLTA